MNQSYKYTVKDRFLAYVQIDTQADPTSGTFPSSAKQFELTKLLCEELKEMQIEYTTNEAGYVYGFLPSNVAIYCPKVFFCSHIDTAPDCSGTNVMPLLHKNYNGQDLVLPDDTTQTLTTTKHPNLLKKMGHDIITASGLTLLGADDKAGIAIIMDAFYQLKNNPELPHGDLRMLITTDEEIGKGIAKVDKAMLDSDFGYTLDSGDLGSIEGANFSADSLELTIHGVSAHPGYAGKMENSIKIIAEIIDALPKDTLTPEKTSGMQGFIHPGKLHGELEKASVGFILRDFDTSKLVSQRNLIEDTTNRVLQNYPNSRYEITQKTQYRNMKEVLDANPHVMDLALKAIAAAGITAKVGSIRGGTDGAGLSQMGLPCPNIFAGQQAIHSRQEWVSVQDMQQAVDTVIQIAILNTQSK